jgi:16S rRNA processing protein RimM
MGFIPVGRIVAAHGVRGEVKFKYYNETATASPEYPSFFVDPKGTKIELRPARIRRQGNLFLIKFKNLERVEDIGFLLGKELHVSEDDLAPLGENEYYDYQLIGLQAITETGRVIGKVQSVIHIRERDVLVLDGVPEVLVPMTEDHIVKISSGEGVVQIREEALVE